MSIVEKSLYQFLFDTQTSLLFSSKHYRRASWEHITFVSGFQTFLRLLASSCEICEQPTACLINLVLQICDNNDRDALYHILISYEIYHKCIITMKYIVTFIIRKNHYIISKV